MKIIRIQKGSLTVEAALVLPVFIYAVLIFLYLIKVINVQEEIQSGITIVAKYASKYAYVYENRKELEKKQKDTLEQVMNAAFIKLKFKEVVDDDKINNSCILHGINGISMLKSDFMKNNKSIDVVAEYKIKMPIAFFHINNISMVQRVKTRGFVGSRKLDDSETDLSGGEKNTDDRIVYITETGKVYHLSRECTHLKLSIKMLTIKDIEDLRNRGGGIYKKCDLCCKSSNSTETVYITNYGDRYHFSLSCPGLKRSIIAIPLSKAGNRSLCTKCAGKLED